MAWLCIDCKYFEQKHHPCIHTRCGQDGYYFMEKDDATSTDY